MLLFVGMLLRFFRGLFPDKAELAGKNVASATAVPRIPP